MPRQIQLMKRFRNLLQGKIKRLSRAASIVRGVHNVKPEGIPVSNLENDHTLSEDEIVYQVRAQSWQNDPAEETWKLTDLDYTMPPVFLKTMLVYQVNDSTTRAEIVSNLTSSLAATLTQCRTLNSVLRKSNGQVELVRTRGAAVPFIVHHSTRKKGPISFDDLQAAGFPPTELSSHTKRRGMSGQTPNEPAGSIVANRPVTEFQVTWIPGGLILTFGFHHYCIDGGGICAFIRQWAENAIERSKGTTKLTTPWSSDEPDRQRLNVKGTAEPNREPLSEEHPSAVPSMVVDGLRPVVLHFHQGGIEKIKRMASFDNVSVSTYDAASAFLWRILTRARLSIYDPQEQESTQLAQAVDLRQRFNPPLSPSYQGNATMCALTENVRVLDVVKDGNLPYLASVVRQAHMGITEEKAAGVADMVATLADKTSAAWSGKDIPRFFTAITDRRRTSHYDADFGFNTPRAVRNVYQPNSPCIMRNAPLSSTHSLPRGPVLEMEIPVDISCVEYFIQDANLLDCATVVSA